MSQPSPKLNGQFLDMSDQRWLNFASQSAQSCIFHHPAWSRLLEQAYGYRPFLLAVCDSDGTIRAGFPVIEVKSPLGTPRWISLPFSDHCRPLSTDPTSLHALTDFLYASYLDRKLARLELRWTYPSRAPIQSKHLFVLHTIQLPATPEAAAQGIHSMHRRNINTAQKRGVRVVSGNGLAELKAFYRLHTQTRRRQGMPVQPWSFFEALQRAVVEPGHGFILLAYEGQDCLAAAVFLHWGKTLTYKYGASTVEGLRLRPNDLIFWEAIRWGCEHGYEILDLGRTDLENTGLREFKSRWGAEETSLAYSFIPAAPAASGPGTWLPLFQEVIRRSPLWVCRMSGELLYRFFG